MSPVHIKKLTNPDPTANLTYEWHGLTKVWRYRGKDATITMPQVASLHKLRMPRYKRYLDEMHGTPITTIWDDIRQSILRPLNVSAIPHKNPSPTRTHYCRQQQRGRYRARSFLWLRYHHRSRPTVGPTLDRLDITHLSIALQKYRLKDSFGLVAREDYDVIGEPVDTASASQLANDDRYQFQWWALSLIQARPLGGTSGSKRGKKGADQGIDGLISSSTMPAKRPSEPWFK